MHEALHIASRQSGVRAILGGYVEEGLTEWLARLEFGPEATRFVYEGNLAFVKLLAKEVGEDTLRNAYLHAQWRELRTILVRRLGSEEKVQLLYRLLRQVGPNGQRGDALNRATRLLWPGRR